jgi:hypothetical protein
MKMDNNSEEVADTNCKVKTPFKSSSSPSLFKSIVQLRASLNESYMISFITHPATTTTTTTNKYSTMVDLIDPIDGNECLITAFGDEAIALLKFVEGVLDDMG